MSEMKSEKTIQLSAYITATYDCSYLSGKKACSEVVVPQELVGTHVYSQLVNMGFRRSGMLVYRPACDVCHACTPIRVDVDAFQPSKTQKKASKKLSHLDVCVLDINNADGYYALYQKYQRARHLGGGMDEDKRDEYESFLLESNVFTQAAEFRDPAAAGALKMVAVMDILQDGVSAVYTYYDPDDERLSYGTHAILWQIAYAKKLGLPYVYLGYWIKDSQKMSYKSNFKPFEILTDLGWQKGE